MTSPGLYIHIPVCLSKCGYCSFYSVAAPELIPRFIPAVIGEMAFYENHFRNFDTVYFGGGTPSVLPATSIEEILNAAHAIFGIDRHVEITLEANPGDLSLEYLHSLRALGINRLNIGVQSFDNGLLKFLGRRHTASEALRAVDQVRRAGFDNIGIDLIYAIHGQSIELWRQTLETAASFVPEHLSCYQLTLEPKTPLFLHYRREGFKLPGDDESMTFFTTTSTVLSQKGYDHYEVSNFSLSPSSRSRHNLKYWRHIPYLGLGPSAHSFSDGRRWWNIENAHDYITGIAGSRKVVSQSEDLITEQLALEALFLGLRTKDGIDLSKYKAEYGTDLLHDKKKTIAELKKNKLIEIKEGRLRPTLAGVAVADSLALI